MYLRGHKGYKENLAALTKNQNDLEVAIKLKEPSELEKVTADLKARLEKIGAHDINNV
jgi:hypothetical protein